MLCAEACAQDKRPFEADRQARRSIRNGPGRLVTIRYRRGSSPDALRPGKSISDGWPEGKCYAMRGDDEGYTMPEDESDRLDRRITGKPPADHPFRLPAVRNGSDTLGPPVPAAKRL